MPVAGGRCAPWLDFTIAMQPLSGAPSASPAVPDEPRLAPGTSAEKRCQNMESEGLVGRMNNLPVPLSGFGWLRGWTLHSLVRLGCFNRSEAYASDTWEDDELAELKEHAGGSCHEGTQFSLKFTFDARVSDCLPNVRWCYLQMF